MDRRRSEPLTGVVELQAGTVTSLAPKGSGGERWGVYLDGRLAFHLAAALVTEKGLGEGDFLTPERQASLLEEDEPYRARGTALSMLARRARCRLEVETKLRRSGFSAESIEQTVAWLEAQGYVDDRRFASAYAAERLKSGWGRQRILSELSRKGIPRTVVEREVWDQAVAGARAHPDTPTLLSLVERRFGRQLEVDPERARRRIVGFLARRGHDWDEISRITELLRKDSARES